MTKIVKTCKRCKIEATEATVGLLFYPLYDGWQHYCKECAARYSKDKLDKSGLRKRSLSIKRKRNEGKLIHIRERFKRWEENGGEFK
jgi:hypothetical protein